MSARRRIVVAAAAAAVLVAADPDARAQQTLTVGVFTPSAPFEGPVARLEFASQLATHVAGAVGGVTGVGRAYARASDFGAAVRRGELQYAVVDAAYLAASGAPYRVLAAVVRDGATGTPWELVTRLDARSVIDLRGKSVAVPRLGARDDAFIAQVLLDGELPDGFFGGRIEAPDALSAVAALAAGRADAAFVPLGLPLPAGVHRVLVTREIGWAVLVALPGGPPGQAEKVATAVTGFAGGRVFGGFRAGGGDLVRALAGRFGKRERRGPMADPPPRFVDLRGLLEGRKFTIERGGLEAYADEEP